MSVRASEHWWDGVGKGIFLPEKKKKTVGVHQKRLVFSPQKVVTQLSINTNATQYRYLTLGLNEWDVSADFYCLNRAFLIVQKKQSLRQFIFHTLKPLSHWALWFLPFSVQKGLIIIILQNNRFRVTLQDSEMFQAKSKMFCKENNSLIIWSLPNELTSLFTAWKINQFQLNKRQ